MFGLMEIQELLSSYNKLYPHYEVGIVPTVLLPLAFLSTGISVVATFVAGLFGVKLKAEGPKKLLELLLRPRILVSALVLNACLYGVMQGYQYVKNGPVPLVVQSLLNKKIDFVVAAKPGDDKLYWQQNIGEGIFAKGVVYKDELFVGTKEGNLFVLDIDSGKVTHKIFFGKFLSPTPVVYKDHLYFGEGLHASHHMRVYKFDPVSKKVVGSFKTKGHTEIFPVVQKIENKDYLFQAAGGDGLYAIDPISMKKIWHYKDGHMDAFTLIDGDFLYIGSGIPLEDIGKKRAYAYKLEAKTGKLVWKKELALSSWFGPLKSGKRICFIQGELHVKSELGGISCFSPSGERLNSMTIESPIIGKPLVYGDDIVLNDFNGGLYSWNSSSGKFNWKSPSNNKKIKYSYSSVQPLAKNILFVNPRGEVSKVDKESGEVLSIEKFNLKESVFSDPLIYEDGYMLFGMKGTIKYYKR